MVLGAISHRFPMRCNVVRLGPVVGAPAFEGGPFKSDRRFFKIAKAARSVQPALKAKGSMPNAEGLNVSLNPSQGRQFVAAKDAAKVYRTLLKSDFNRNVFICVASNLTLWLLIAIEIARTGGFPLNGLGKSDDRIKQRIFNVDKLEKRLGFRFNSREAITEHIGQVLALT
jgi:nucleoside-diphosphate-sugar epimerase